MNAPERFSEVEVAASEWLVTMSDRTVSLEDRARFDAWLTADPEHARIYRVQKEAWTAIGTMPYLIEDSGTPRAALRSLRAGARRAALRPLSLAAAILLVGIGGVIAAKWLLPSGRFTTQTAQVKDVRLDDGTLVTLGALSTIKTEFTTAARRVTLLQGEAFFEVTRDSTRPFLVSAGDTEVRVLGTKFDVHYGAAAVKVSVLEGRVEVGKPVAVRTSSSAGDRRILNAGETVIAHRGAALPAPQPMNDANLATWRTGRLVYVDAYLHDIVADINRYYPGSVELSDLTVGELQLTTSFRADQIDRAIEVLTSALPIKATRLDGNRIILSSK